MKRFLKEAPLKRMALFLLLFAVPVGIFEELMYGIGPLTAIVVFCQSFAFC